MEFLVNFQLAKTKVLFSNYLSADENTRQQQSNMDCPIKFDAKRCQVSAARSFHKD